MLTPSPIRRRPRLPLTARQQQVLTLLKNSALNRKQAAHTLRIGLATLNGHITSALSRLNVPSITSALDLIP